VSELAASLLFGLLFGYFEAGGLDLPTVLAFSIHYFCNGWVDLSLALCLLVDLLEYFYKKRGKG
jgi:hypothetical protein